MRFSEFKDFQKLYFFAIFVFYYYSHSMDAGGLVEIS